MKNFSIKLGIILTVSILPLTACGQKGALYLPKDSTSEMPNQIADNANNANNPTDPTNVQNPNQITPNINPNVQNPNIKIQDKINDY